MNKFISAGLLSLALFSSQIAPMYAMTVQPVQEEKTEQAETKKAKKCCSRRLTCCEKLTLSLAAFAAFLGLSTIKTDGSGREIVATRDYCPNLRDYGFNQAALNLQALHEEEKCSAVMDSLEDDVLTEYVHFSSLHMPGPFSSLPPIPFVVGFDIQVPPFFSKQLFKELIQHKIKNLSWGQRTYILERLSEASQKTNYKEEALKLLK